MAVNQFDDIQTRHLLSSGSTEVHPSPLQRAHRLLRGRYVLAILLAILLGVPGGYFGWHLKDKTYVSSASIGIEPVIPKVLFTTDENRALPLFDQYVLKQAELIDSPQVIERALQHEAWLEHGRTYPPDQTWRFAEPLVIDTQRRSQKIGVSYEDTSPARARAAVAAIVESYLAMHRESAENSVSSRVDQLKKREAEFGRQIAEYKAQRLEFTREYGTDDLASLYSDQLQTINALKAELNELDLAIKLYESAASPTPPDEAEASATPDPRSQEPLTITDIATRDALMRGYVQQQEQMEQEIARLSLKYGESSRQLIEARALLATIDKSIEDYAAKYRDAYRKQQVVQPSLIVRDRASGQSMVSLAQMQERQRLKQALLEKMTASHQALWNKKQQMDAILDQQKLVEAKLVETQRARDALELESQSTVSGRATLLRAPEHAMPTRDHRPILAAFGGVAGACAGLALVMLIGLLDLRLRSMSDAQSRLGEIHQLGILPRLPDDLSDPDEVALAAHCVHRIRTLLQIGSTGDSRRVFAITSPHSQDGKTTLAVALGMSFVVSGSRTLLIDFDIVGGGLSSRTDARRPRRIGKILQREHDLTDDQLNEALTLVIEKGVRMGEALVQLGYVSKAAVEEALAMQPEDHVGILDVMEGEPIEDCISPSGVEGMYVLPIGSAEPEDVSTLSPVSVRRVLDEARANFDVILIDTGPIPGSLEASQIAGVVDGVMLIVSLGEDRRMLLKAVDHLRSLRARIIGYVFNRAEGRDVEEVAKSSMSGSVNQTVGRRRSGRAPVQRIEPPTRLGPVARAVASGSGNPNKGASRRNQ